MGDSLSRVLADLLVVLGATPQDILWPSYDSPEALRADVADLAARVEDGDAEAVQKVRLLFAPTGDLQETAIASGWHDTYMALVVTPVSPSGVTLPARGR